MDFRDTIESRIRGQGGLFSLIPHRPDHYFIMKPRAGRAEKGTWAEITKQQEVHLWTRKGQGGSFVDKKSLVPAFPQSSCRLRLSGWSGLSSCCLPCFLCLYLQKATRNISSSLLRQFPCTSRGRTSALTPGLADGRERQLGTRTGFVTASEIQCQSALAQGENEESSVLPALSSPPEPPREQEKVSCHGKVVPG